MSDSQDGIFLSSISYDFNQDLHGWQYGFSNYPADESDSTSLELKFAYPTTVPGLPDTKSIMLSGNSKGTSLFMFLKKKLTGLRPDAYYTVTFNVEFASNAIKSSAGTNASPGENVFVKVGASQIEPKSQVKSGNFEMNIDKGNQSQSGSDMITIGNIASVKDNDEYVLVTRSNANNYNSLYEVQSNSDGELWIIVGTDSGFSGTTTLYYTKINAVLSSRN